MFVIRNKLTKRFVKGEYETVRGAKIALSRKFNKDEFEVIDRKDDEIVERVNMMTGVKYKEPLNTPAYLSPSCESYWSF